MADNSFRPTRRNSYEGGTSKAGAIRSPNWPA